MSRASSLTSDPFDSRIRQALGEHDPEALTLIWDAYAHDLFALVLSIVCSKHAAEDVMQNVFVKLAENHARLLRCRELKPYIFRIARNEAVDATRRRRRMIPMDPHDIWVNAPQEDKSSPDAERAASVMARLPRKQREVLVLKIYRDMTFADIAALLGISANTAASRYRYGIAKLRRQLTRTGTP